MIWLANPESGKLFAVRGYDYTMVREDGVLIPAKIEIFRTDSRGLLKERLVKIDFKKK